ncbi:HMA2 domain-containing protein [uncultured Sutterella sp.]|uniref:HMA2 domain-containing protein n=1 Tax=uncultured Sutterella sp. TaxID=286133 RepID=UPI002630636F|nr:hypothetical protein [uncultured Sutterella sp.]
MLDPRTFVRSVTHGRARIRHASLKGLSADEAKVIADMVEGFDGITSVSINPRVGSLLVTWDESQTNAEALLQAAAFFLPEDASDAQAKVSCEEAAPQTENTEAPAADSQAPQKKCLKESARKAAGSALAAAEDVAGRALLAVSPLIAPDQQKGGRTKRVTQNRLMLAAYGASLASLFVKSTPLHVGLGVLYTLFLGVHLYQHRRVL